MKITPDLLRELIQYDPETGAFTHKPRTEVHITNASARNGWNSQNASKPAFTTLRPDGYLCGGIMGVSLLAHRVAWAIETGCWPEQTIDHINGDRVDNRWRNLRHVSQQENTQNASRQKRNISGHTGVNWCGRRKAWRVRIKLDLQDVHIGYFQSLERAVTARKEAESKHGFHPNHGRAKS